MVELLIITKNQDINQTNKSSKVKGPPSSLHTKIKETHNLRKNKGNIKNMEIN